MPAKQGVACCFSHLKRWRPSVKNCARSGDRHNQAWHRERLVRLCPRAGCGVLLFPSQTLETFGQKPCSVSRPAQSSSASRAVVAPVPAKQGMAICLLIHQLETFGRCTCAVWRPARSRRKSRLTRPLRTFVLALCFGKKGLHKNSAHK